MDRLLVHVITAGCSPLVLPPSQKVGSAWVSLNLVGCRCTGKGVFQRNPQS